MSSKKKNLGQFFTTNYNYILQNFKIPVKVIEENMIIIEPFAGGGDLIKYVKDIYPSFNNIEAYDIDVKDVKDVKDKAKDIKISKRDTLSNPPSYHKKYVITNPPYLARNKSENKDLFEKYDCNDLYKCFIKEISEKICFGGILIVPLNFFSSIRKADIELREKFLNSYKIEEINIFEEQVFDDTSYTVCSFQFIQKEEKDEKEEKAEDIIKINIYPKNKTIFTSLSENNNFMIGGEIYKLTNDKKISITRLTSKNKKDKNRTNILVKCIDDSEKNKIKLSYVDEKEVYIDETPNCSARTYATLIIEPKLCVNNQKKLVIEFNNFLEEKREEFHSLFLTNYRESKDIARKRISFDLVYDICNYILSTKINKG